MPVDDPQRRRADTSRAKEVLQWQPQYGVREGVREMVKWVLRCVEEATLTVQVLQLAAPTGQDLGHTQVAQHAQHVTRSTRASGG